MRIVYVDESGISANEAILVVAAVIIHADSQWVPVEEHIGRIIQNYVAEEDREGFVFHATDLYFGSGKIFGNRDKYPLGKSREILKEILAIPSKFHLPIVFGFTRKEPEKVDQSKKIRREERAYRHGRAFTLCTVGIEKYMRHYAAPSEIATITAEDNTETKKTVKWMVDMFRSSHPEAKAFLQWQSTIMKFPIDFLPLRKIVHTVHFAAKPGRLSSTACRRLRVDTPLLHRGETRHSGIYYRFCSSWYSRRGPTEASDELRRDV